jgi:hypothetical protein
LDLSVTSPNYEQPHSVDRHAITGQFTGRVPVVPVVPVVPGNARLIGLSSESIASDRAIRSARIIRKVYLSEDLRALIKDEFRGGKLAYVAGIVLE